MFRSDHSGQSEKKVCRGDAGLGFASWRDFESDFLKVRFGRLPDRPDVLSSKIHQSKDLGEKPSTVFVEGRSRFMDEKKLPIKQFDHERLERLAVLELTQGFFKLLLVHDCNHTAAKAAMKEIRSAT